MKRYTEVEKSNRRDRWGTSESDFHHFVITRKILQFKPHVIFILTQCMTALQLSEGFLNVLRMPVMVKVGDNNRASVCTIGLLFG